MSGTIGDTLVGLAETLARVLAGPKGTCVTFTLEGDEGRWLQFVDDQINMACIADSLPADLIADLGEAEIISFEPRQHLTVTTTLRDPERLSAWIHGYFVRALDADEGFRFDAAIEQL
jgi:hypothetical protein